MPTDDSGPDKPNDDGRTDTSADKTPTEPLIHVDVPRETVRKAARLADEHGIALEDALARLTAYDFPADAVTESAGTTCGSEGP